METKPNHLIVGIFVLGLMIMGTVFVVWFSKLDIGSSHNLYYIYFDGSVTGLRENEDVLYQGIAIGKVKKIQVYKSDVQRIKVLVTITRPDILRENSIATIEAQGLTGYTFIQIKGSTQDSPLLKANEGHRYPVIQSRPSNLEALFSSTPKILAGISKVSLQLEKFFDNEMIQDSKETLRNLRQITTGLSQGPDSLTFFLKDFRDTLLEFKQASVSFKHFLKENTEAMSTFTRTGLPAFTKMSQSLQKTSDHIDQIVKEVETSPTSFLTRTSHQGYKVP